MRERSLRKEQSNSVSPQIAKANNSNIIQISQIPHEGSPSALSSSILARASIAASEAFPSVTKINAVAKSAPTCSPGMGGKWERN
jgi:hypothetical protein